jgi:tetratricopeptide (TPR) repeat protein
VPRILSSEAMSEERRYRYDLYISYNETDAEWIFEWLLPRLTQAGLVVAVDVESFQPGAPVLEETERVIGESRYILAILTPAYVDASWKNFETLLVQNDDPGARFRRLIPVLLQECDPPQRIKLLHWVDLTDPARREENFQRVVRAVQGSATLPELHPERAIPTGWQRLWEVRWLALVGLISLATLAGVVMLLLSGREQGPEQMRSDRMGMAVAAVGHLDVSGAMGSTDLSRLLSQMLYEGLQDEYTSNRDPDIQLWHNGLSNTEMRNRLPVIQGSTRQDRAEHARKLAEQIRATVIIYGHLTADEPPHFVLEIYHNDPLLRSESVHTLGRYQFGDSLRINTDLAQADNRETARLRAQVTQRATTLYHLLRALHQDLLGNADRARAILEAEERRIQDWEATWNRVAGGKDILYFFIGRSLLFLDRYEDAADALDRSLAINPQFAQAQITKGAVYFQEIIHRPIDEQEIDTFDEAIDAYRRGKLLAEQSGDPLLITLADLALAIALRQQGGIAYSQESDDRALVAFDEAIPLLQGVQAELEDLHQYRLLGQTYESLGLANFQKGLIMESRGDSENALALYMKAASDFELCTRQSEHDGRSDYILLNDIVVRNCWPMRAWTYETIGRLHQRQAEALSAEEQAHRYTEATAAFESCIAQQGLLEEELRADALILEQEPLEELRQIAEGCRRLLSEAQEQITALRG